MRHVEIKRNGFRLSIHGCLKANCISCSICRKYLSISLSTSSCLALADPSRIRIHEWQEFFRDFTRFHQGWIASVDIFSQALGAQKEANELVFAGIVAEKEHQGKITIEVMLGETTTHHLTHTIVAPTRVRFENSVENEILQIEEGGDTTVLISCHRSALPAKASYGGLQEI
jgi:hypothetical protein